MANPVSFREFTPTNSRQDLLRRLEAAPEQHVEALLASYELLQRMHDEGLIDLANSLLSAGGTIMKRVADLMDAAELVATIRAALAVTNLLRAVDLNELHNLLSGANFQSPSLMRLRRELMSEDARVGLVTSVGLLKVFGAAIRRRGWRQRPESASGRTSDRPTWPSAGVASEGSGTS